MNINLMYAYYAHRKKDFKTEAASCQYGIWQYLEAMLNMLIRLGKVYAAMDRYADAVTTLEYAEKLINITVGDETVLPPLHQREQGDLCEMLADCYLHLGNEDTALSYLEKMVIV